MSDVLLPKLRGWGRGRPFEKDRSGNPAAHRTGGPPSEDPNPPETRAITRPLTGP
jgi:hypothetical protein